MLLRTLVVVPTLLFACPALADSLDLNLRNDAVQFTYGYGYRAAEVTGGALWREKEDGRGTRWAAHLGLLASGERESPASRWQAGLGGRLYFAEAGSSEALALALGGQVRWSPGNSPIGIGAYGFFAPDIVTGLDARHFWEAGARVELEAVRNTAYVYVGYRKMEMRLESDADVTLDRGGHLGVRIVF
jgi:YfaZ precursor